MVVCSCVCTPEMTTVIKTDSLDFDRDEMNVHFPQDEISRAEAYNIVNANNQYARPSNGDPLRALIQNPVYQIQLLTVTPSILKPVPLWTGKQVITAVLTKGGHPPFSVEKYTKLPVDFFKCRSIEAKSKSGESNKKTKKHDVNEDKLLIRKKMNLSAVNFQLISSHLGQQYLEGMVSWKTDITLLPFHPWELEVLLVIDSLAVFAPKNTTFIVWLDEKVFDIFVLALGNRLRHSGLQRWLMKNLESLKVNYDCTIRDADGSIIQFQYGEDGVDVHRSSFIQKFKEMTIVSLPFQTRSMLSGSSTDLPITLKEGAEKDDASQITDRLRKDYGSRYYKDIEVFVIPFAVHGGELEDAIETHIKMLYRIRCIKVEKDKGPKSGNETDKDDSDSGEVMMTRARIQRLMT
ncbi:hypothetical protein HID58_082624, partial [Brassica napus]